VRKYPWRPEPTDHRTGLGPEEDRVAWHPAWVGRDRLGPMGSKQVPEVQRTYPQRCLTPPTDTPGGATGVGAGWTPGRDRVGNGQTDERRAGVGETSDVGFEGPVQAWKRPCRSD
jgi:hypothetical protein